MLLLNSNQIIDSITNGRESGSSFSEMSSIISYLLKPYKELIDLFELKMQMIDEGYKANVFMINSSDTIIGVVDKCLIVSDIWGNYHSFDLRILDDFEKWKSKEIEKVRKRLTKEYKTISNKLENLKKL